MPDQSVVNSDLAARLANLGTFSENISDEPISDKDAENWHEPVVNIDSNLNNEQVDCYMATQSFLSNRKTHKKTELCTIALGYVHSKKDSVQLKHLKRIKILFDTGCGGTCLLYTSDAADE